MWKDSEMSYQLPDGLVVFVKRDCPTCELVAPVLAQLADDVTIFTQDDPTFPDGLASLDDTGLAMSWHNDIETVPTLIRMENDEETGRIVGWSQDAWQSFTGIKHLGEGLPDYRPGCGSLSVDPEHADRLAAEFGGSVLKARRIEFAELEDHVEAMYDRGWSDGLPLVAPTEVRVMRMLEGTSRDPSDIVAVVPPTLVEATVEKVAINAVMAGCKPEYLPVVIAALEAICTDEFNMHGLLATTMPCGPVFVINGPIRDQIGMNHGINVLGQGNRANSTIGRAVQLIIRNIGGGLPGELDRATHGSPAKLGLCFPEDEAGSPWQPLSVDRGFDEGANTVTAFAGESPRILLDQLSRSPEALTLSLAESLKATISPRLAMRFDGILVISPEHVDRYREAGWGKERFMGELRSALEMDTNPMLRGAGGIDEGVPEAFADSTLPKFDPNGGLLVVHAGGPAGLFSSVIGGWVNGDMGSTPVTKEIHQ